MGTLGDFLPKRLELALQSASHFGAASEPGNTDARDQSLFESAAVVASGAEEMLLSFADEFAHWQALASPSSRRPAPLGVTLATLVSEHLVV